MTIIAKTFLMAVSTLGVTLLGKVRVDPHELCLMRNPDAVTGLTRRRCVTSRTCGGISHSVSLFPVWTMGDCKDSCSDPILSQSSSVAGFTLDRSLGDMTCEACLHIVGADPRYLAAVCDRGMTIRAVGLGGAVSVVDPYTFDLSDDVHDVLMTGQAGRVVNLGEISRVAHKSQSIE